MFEFNNGVNKIKLNSFETTKKAKKEENKPQEKTVEASSAKAREKLIKAFAGINSNTRRGNRAYNEMYISNPNVMGVFAYPTNSNNEIGDTMKFVKKQKEFLQKYAIEHDVPMIVFGE